MNPIEKFNKEKIENIENQGKDVNALKLAGDLLLKLNNLKYSYNFTWMGRPIIQYPQDIIAMQEIIWEVQPDLIIETGVAHGGSIIFSASMLELIGNDGQVIGIDIDIRAHNRTEIEQHKLFKRITLLEGSSTDKTIVEKVYKIAKNKNKIMVILDSNHTHDHVLQELNLYANLTTVGSYCLVFDTIIEDMPDGSFPDRPWGKGNNPKTAVWEFLKANDNFEIDKTIENKLLITVAPSGYLKRTK
jgi:cephalosporin hydroxylase